jgi:hypothetical protein
MTTGLGELAGLSLLIALGFLAAVAFYESLSTRDVLLARVLRRARRSERRWLLGVAYATTVGVGMPVLVVLWAIVLEAVLLLVGSVERVASVALLAVSMVAATRILAYVRERTAHELAKAIPLALAFMLLTGGALNLDEKFARLAARPEVTSLTTQMIVFLIVLEVGLRLLTDGTTTVLAAYRRRQGSDTELGAWRTVWAALHRTIRSRGSRQ